MASMKETVRQAGTQLGMRTRPDQSTVFGDLHGYLVQMTPIKNERGHESIATIIHHGDRKSSAPTGAVLEGADLDTAGIKPKDISYGDDFVAYKLGRGFVRGPDAAAVVRTFGTVFDRVRALRDPVKAVCGGCEAPHSGDPLLVNGVIRRLCASCVDGLHRATQEARAAYDSLPLSLPRAIVVAGVLAIVGALIWAAIAIATNSMFWLIAIAIGAVIGIATTKAAGRRATIVQVISGVATVMSVLLGQLAIVAYVMQRAAEEEHVHIDWLAFIAATPQILIESGSDTIFALGGGLIGAAYAARSGAKPKMEIKIDS